ncbi:MAG: FISUMP domain-containing protein [Marinifilaceae bacterium]
MKRLIILGLTILALLSSCSKDGDVKKLPKASVLSFPISDAVINDTKVKLEWVKSSEKGVSYIVYIGITEVLDDSNMVVSGITLNKHTVRKLLGSRMYFWKVAAVNSVGEKVYSKISTFRTGFMPSSPIYPANKSIIDSKSVTLEWNENGDPSTKYDVFLSKDEQFVDSKKIEEGTKELKHTVDNLDSGSTYFWKVIAINGEGKQVPADVFSFSNGLPSKAQLEYPREKATLIKTNVDFRWEESVVADGSKPTYSVYLGYNNYLTDANKKVSDLQMPSFTITNLKEDTKYFWKIISTDKNGRSTDSDIYSFTTDKTPEIKLVAPLDGFIGEIPECLEWEPIPGFTYDVYLVKGENHFENINMIKRKSRLDNFKPTTIEPDATYYWKIHAVNVRGTEFKSEVFSFRTKKKEIKQEDGTFTYDERKYKTVSINGDEWFAENYAYIPDNYREKLIGSDVYKYLCVIPGVPVTTMITVDGETRLVHNTVYDSKESIRNNINYKKYGLLYSMVQDNSSASDFKIEENIPEGWHISTDKEWNDLEQNFGMSVSGREYRTDRGSHGPRLKGNIDDSDDCSWPKNEATNESQLTILPTGLGMPDNSMVKFGERAYMWTASVSDRRCYFRILYANNPSVMRSAERLTRKMAIRLVKGPKPENR